MRKRSRSSDEELLRDFRTAAMDYGGALECGDHKAANRASRLGGKLRKEIVARGDQSLKLLLQMIDDQDPWIRYAAAASTIDIEPERAYQTLLQLQTLPKSIGATAFTTIQMWETEAFPPKD